MTERLLRGVATKGTIPEKFYLGKEHQKVHLKNY